MLISIDFVRLQRHIDSLDEELHLVKQMIAKAQLLYTMSLEDPYDIPQVYQRQLQFLRQEQTQIESRKSLLTQTLDVFTHVNRQLEHKIEELREEISATTY